MLQCVFCCTTVSNIIVIIGYILLSLISCTGFQWVGEHLVQVLWTFTRGWLQRRSWRSVFGRWPWRSTSSTLTANSPRCVLSVSVIEVIQGIIEICRFVFEIDVLFLNSHGCIARFSDWVFKLDPSSIVFEKIYLPFCLLSSQCDFSLEGIVESPWEL